MDFKENCANELIKKISNASGILFEPLLQIINAKANRKIALIEKQTEQELIMIDKIMISKELSQSEKMLIVSSIHKGIHELKNITDILGYALEDIESTVNFENVDNDWISLFCEKGKNITKTDLKKVWGKLLAEQMNTEREVPKTLLNTLYLMDKRHIEAFTIIRKYCFYNLKDSFRVYPCLFLVDMPSFYNKAGIYRYLVEELAFLGLLEYNWEYEYVFPNDVNLRYGDKIITLNCKERMTYGNVKMTHNGSVLNSIFDHVISSEIFEFCLKVFKNKGYSVFLNE